MNKEDREYSRARMLEEAEFYRQVEEWQSNRSEKERAADEWIRADIKEQNRKAREEWENK